jgi:Sensors of blue-light using FAD
MTATGLEAILLDARAGNNARDITGILVYVDGVFLQVIEGDREAVLQLMTSLGKDSRHSSIKIIHEAEIEERTFASWRMAYLDATPEQMAGWAELAGTTTIESILEDLSHSTRRAARVPGNLLKALAP